MGARRKGAANGDDFVDGWVGGVGRLQRLRCGEARAKRFAPPRGSSTSYTRGERGVRGDRHRCHRGKGETEEVLHDGKEEFCSCGQPLMIARMWPWHQGRVAGGARRGCKEQQSGRQKTVHNSSGGHSGVWCSAKERGGEREKRRGWGPTRRPYGVRGGGPGRRQYPDAVAPSQAVQRSHIMQPTVERES
jgi:hypothetical protein